MVYFLNFHVVLSSVPARELRSSDLDVAIEDNWVELLDRTKEEDRWGYLLGFLVLQQFGVLRHPTLCTKRAGGYSSGAGGTSNQVNVFCYQWCSEGVQWGHDFYCCHGVGGFLPVFGPPGGDVFECTLNISRKVAVLTRGVFYIVVGVLTIVESIQWKPMKSLGRNLYPSLCPSVGFVPGVMTGGPTSRTFVNIPPMRVGGMAETLSIMLPSEMGLE